MQVIVLGGGNSPERAVSLRSSKAVAAALREAGYEVIEKDPADGIEFLDDLPKDCIVFPILHGAEGEDGSIQLELENRGLKFLGSGSESSRNCFDKDEARKILVSQGIKMPEAGVVSFETYSSHPLKTKPHALKAARGGSSIGTYLVKDPENIDEAKVKEVFDLDNKAVIEELIVGPEITVPVLGEKALPVIEIIPPESGEFDYENKYNGQTQELIPSINVSEEKQKEAQELAEAVHKIMGCRHLSRTDIMMSSAGDLFVLEINTIPGMTDQSLYPKAAAAAGLSMPELMKEFIKLIN